MYLFVPSVALTSRLAPVSTGILRKSIRLRKNSIITRFLLFNILNIFKAKLSALERCKMLSSVFTLSWDLVYAESVVSFVPTPFFGLDSSLKRTWHLLTPQTAVGKFTLYQCSVSSRIVCGRSLVWILAISLYIPRFFSINLAKSEIESQLCDGYVLSNLMQLIIRQSMLPLYAILCEL
jgi:hypothetical protein